LQAIQIRGESRLDQPRQRRSLIDGGVLDATDERRRQIDVELLFVLSRSRLHHAEMLAN
jgi:hypothetical protein